MGDYTLGVGHTLRMRRGCITAQATPPPYGRQWSQKLAGDVTVPLANLYGHWRPHGGGAWPRPQCIHAASLVGVFVNQKNAWKNDTKNAAFFKKTTLSVKQP